MRRITVSEAKALLDEGWIYLDVRTEDEYAAGHPAAALNIPWSIREGGRLVDNAQFMQVVASTCARDTRLVVGCAAGIRSLHAAEALIAAGYSDVVEMRAGYSGIRDPFGQITEKGWARAGMPTELETPGGSYEELKSRTRTS